MKLKNYIILLIALIGFTPCSVKQGVFDVFSLEYQRTFNINKTVQNTSCVASAPEITTVATYSKQRLFDPFFTKINSFFAYKEVLKLWNEKELVNRGPPFYILYQKLKIAAILQE